MIKNIVGAALEAVFEKIDDVIDAIEFKRAMAEDDGIRYSHEQILEMLELTSESPSSDALDQ